MEPDAELEPRIAKPADETDVMREQLEYLIDHIAEQGICGCPDCRRYLRTRAVLLEIFRDPARRRMVHSSLPAAA